MSELSERCAHYEEILRLVCHHLELPQSESGPADDLSLYDRALAAADEYTCKADADLAENTRLRFKAEAELHRLREACEPFIEAAQKLPDSRLMHEKSPFWRRAEIEWGKSSQQLTTGQFREMLYAYEASTPTPAPREVG